MSADPTTDPRLRSWVEVAEDSPFPIQNLPHGVFRRPGEAPRLGVAVGDFVLDLAGLAEAGLLDNVGLPNATYRADSLNPLLAAGRPAWRALRARLSALLEITTPDLRDSPDLVSRVLVPRLETETLVPIRPGDYVDFYSSLQHATNLGRLFRPDGEPLLPNWRHLPIGYHGRSSSIVASGTPIQRPAGQLKSSDRDPRWGPTERLDIELEIGFVTGNANRHGESVPIGEAEEHIFGVMLVNDWSARDIQAWEYQPLGPFLGKSFATSVGDWVVSLDALEPYRVAAPVQDPPVLAYLREEERRGIDLHLEVALSTAAMSRPQTMGQVNFSEMYWTMAQQLAHLTSNGTPVRAGDLYASGTVSGSEADSYGSFIELTANGAEPLELAGSEQSFLEDGDTVILRGFCHREGMPRIGLGEVTGQIVPWA